MATRSAAAAKPVEKESKIEAPKAEVAKTPKVSKEKKPAASKYPAEHVVTLLVDYNPKRAGSASHARFDKYEDEMTVKAALEAGLWAGDLNWDVAHEFIKIAEEFDDKAEKKSKPAPKPKAEAKPKAEKKAKTTAKPKPVDDDDKDEPEED